MFQVITKEQMMKYISKMMILFGVLVMLVSTVSVQAMEQQSASPKQNVFFFAPARETTLPVPLRGDEKVGEVKEYLKDLGYNVSDLSYDPGTGGSIRVLKDSETIPIEKGATIIIVEKVSPASFIASFLAPRPAAPPSQVQPEGAPSVAESPAAARPVPTPPSTRTFPSKMQARIGVGVGTTAAALAAAGALYAGLKWYQRKSIRSVIKNYELNLTDFSPTQKDAMAAAFRASYRVPGAIKKLGMLAKKDQFVSHTVPAETMWSIVAEIYYKKSPTPQEIQALKERV